MISEIMAKMIEASEGSLHDINHFIKVWSYAKTIGELEGLDEETQQTLEIAAIVHDIACPGLRKKYGRCDGKLQEREGMPLTREFLADAGLPEAQLERIVYLVGHHHTLTGADGIDYQILIEADFIVNADENGYSSQLIEHDCNTFFRTETGKKILRSIYGLQ